MKKAIEETAKEAVKECEGLETCPFFNDRMANMPDTAQLYKRRYCRGDNSVCARYMVSGALGKERVPMDLFPNQHRKALALIHAG